MNTAGKTIIFFLVTPMLIALTNTVAFAAAVPISVAIPSSTPPYVIQKNQTGIVLNILKKALKSLKIV